MLGVHITFNIRSTLDNKEEKKQGLSQKVRRCVQRVVHIAVQESVQGVKIHIYTNVSSPCSGRGRPPGRSSSSFGQRKRLPEGSRENTLSEGWVGSVMIFRALDLHRSL